MICYQPINQREREDAKSEALQMKARYDRRHNEMLVFAFWEKYCRTIYGIFRKIIIKPFKTIRYPIKVRFHKQIEDNLFKNSGYYAPKGKRILGVVLLK